MSSKKMIDVSQYERRHIPTKLFLLLFLAEKPRRHKSRQTDACLKKKLSVKKAQFTGCILKVLKIVKCLVGYTERYSSLNCCMLGKKYNKNESPASFPFFSREEGPS